MKWSRVMVNTAQCSLVTQQCRRHQHLVCCYSRLVNSQPVENISRKLLTTTTTKKGAKREFTTDDEMRARKAFIDQPLMKTIGATLTKIGAGICEIEMPFQHSLTQQNGFLHAGIVTTLMDNAAGFSAYTLMKPDHGVLTISFTVNLMSPALGTKFVAKSKVIKAGATISTCQSDLYAVQVDGSEKIVATMLASLMSIDPNRHKA